MVVVQRIGEPNSVQNISMSTHTTIGIGNRCQRHGLGCLEQIGEQTHEWFLSREAAAKENRMEGDLCCNSSTSCMGIATSTVITCSPSKRLHSGSELYQQAKRWQSEEAHQDPFLHLASIEEDEHHSQRRMDKGHHQHSCRQTEQKAQRQPGLHHQCTVSEDHAQGPSTTPAECGSVRNKQQQNLQDIRVEVSRTERLEDQCTQSDIIRLVGMDCLDEPTLETAPKSMHLDIDEAGGTRLPARTLLEIDTMVADRRLEGP